MKRTILFALMIPLLLTGCGARRDAENWKAFAETVETAERISFHAEITAHWEDSSASFGADVARAGGEDAQRHRPRHQLAVHLREHAVFVGPPFREA